MPDPNPGGNPDVITLRDAVRLANADPDADVIRFEPSLFEPASRTITLSQNTLELTEHVIVYGPGADLLSVSANNRLLAGGRGLFNVSSGIDVTIYGLTIADGNGNQGIHNAGNLIADHIVVSDNAVEDDFGGGISNSGTLELTNSTIVGNFAAAGAGLYNEAEATIENTTLIFNHSTSDGGAIHGVFGSVAIANSTISSNSADGHGGGIANEANVELTSVTVTLNVADSDDVGGGEGGGLHATKGSRFMLVNTIVAGNLRYINKHDDLTLATDVLDREESRNMLIGDPATAAGIEHGFQRSIVGNGFGEVLPIEDILDTQLRSLGGASQVHPLALNSPALDAGNNSFSFYHVAESGPLPGPKRILFNDQRSFGYRRIVDADDVQGARIDIGAVEMQEGPVVDPSTFVVSDQADFFDDGDYRYGDLTLREALGLANRYPDPNVIVFSDDIRGEINMSTLAGEPDAFTAKWDVKIEGPGARPYLTAEQLAALELTQAELDAFNSELNQTTLTLRGFQDRILVVDTGTAR